MNTRGERKGPLSNMMTSLGHHTGTSRQSGVVDAARKVSLTRLGDRSLYLILAMCGSREAAASPRDAAQSGESETPQVRPHGPSG